MRLANLKSKATSFLDQYKNQDPAAFAAAQQAIGGLLIFDGFFGLPHPMGGRKRPGIFGSVIGIFIGVLFLFIPTIFGSLTGISKLTATTSATIVSVSQHQTTSTNSNGTRQTTTSCSAVAKYTVNGIQYTRQSSFDSSSLCSLGQGDTTQIYYNPNNPGQWGTDVKTIGLFLKIFFFAGILVIISSLFLFIVRLLSIIFGWKILKSGRKLAKTLSPGTDLTTVIKQMENSFKTTLFGFESGGMMPQNPMAMQPPPPTVQQNTTNAHVQTQQNPVFTPTPQPTIDSAPSRPNSQVIIPQQNSDSNSNLPQNNDQPHQ